MKQWRVASATLVVVLGVVLAASGVQAQPPDVVGTSDSSVEQSPLREVIPPGVVGPEPELTLPQCVAGALDVVVTLDDVGTVVDASPGTEVDAQTAELVQTSVRGVRFTPARRDGHAVPSRVIYRLPCTLPSQSKEITQRAKLDDTKAWSLGEPASSQSPTDATQLGQGAPTDEEPVDVVVTGQSVAERLRRGANAVSVVELTSARQRTGTLGEVLARQEGASVRTMGGLGGFTRFALDGLSNEQVRFFIDGVPLRFAGYSLGIANVPVEQLQHVEIHHGVVPARLGADALGGAVNLTTLGTTDGASANASISTGSFGTTRIAASAAHRDSGNHYIVRANAFRDRADNNFWLRDVPIVDAQGRVSKISRPHFHNKYAADGMGVDIGIVEKPWARHLIVRGFYAEHDKEIPHDNIGVDSQSPWGEVTYGKLASGFLAMHQLATERVRMDTRFGFTNERTRFSDMSRCSYDWYGRCFLQRRTQGEISSVPVDSKVSDTFWFARVDGSWLVTPSHEIRLSFAPTLGARQGENEVVLQQSPDPLAAKRNYTTAVVGAEYETRSEDLGWSNNLFAKWYVRYLNATETLPNGNRRDWDQTKDYGGVGDALRFDMSDNLYAKLSYEYALRLPTMDELLGDGGQVIDNLELAAERSHNVNVEMHAKSSWDNGSDLTASVRGFGRFLSDRIWLRAVIGYSVYDNIESSRVVGTEATIQWTAPGQWLNLSGNGTWLYSRDTSGETPSRLPSDPWFWANAQATLTQSGIVTKVDSVNLDWNVNYVHGFPLSVGERGSEQTRLRVAAQTVHTAALRYVLDGERNSLSAAAEMNNVLDAHVMDFFGIQRPGRAFFVKLTFQARSTSSK